MKGINSSKMIIIDNWRKENCNNQARDKEIISLDNGQVAIKLNECARAHFTTLNGHPTPNGDTT